MRDTVGFRPEVGGTVRADIQRDGKIDLSLIAPEGCSAAVYVSPHELCNFALDLLANIAHESGGEIGELVAVRRLREQP